MSFDSEGFTIDLRRIRLLREVDRRGTVAATAAAMHLTPSAVSQQLAGLARDLGVPLLAKQGRGVRLTGQARVLLRHADAVAEQLERARADLAAFDDGLVGEVRIGALATSIDAVVAPALRRLRADRPGLRLLVREQQPIDALAELDSGAVDVIVTVDHPRSPTRGDARYDRVDLLHDVLDVIVDTGHPLAGRRTVDLAELRDDVWIAGRDDDACEQVFTGACAAAGFTPDIQHFTHEYDALAALVAAGAGVGLIPRLALPLRQTDLAILEITGTPPARSVYAATRAGRTTDSPTAAVLTALRAVAADRPDAFSPHVSG
ncbi:LysR family transcriptional regulator [Kineococcus gynurae]|uniref:LysR family transcriptional regulator n=1 Tax=Kineococcus gynurae TaxID=452979 RepID=A0ABV5LRB5_9ACTN